MIWKYLLSKSFLFDSGLLLMYGMSELQGPTTTVQFQPGLDYSCRFGTNLSMNCVAPTPIPVPVPPPVPPPPPVVPSITISGLQPSYTVDSAGTKIIVPFTVAVSNFTPVKMEISRDTFAPFYTWTAPPWANTFCVNCFQPTETLPRDMTFIAKATDAAGKVITASMVIHVMQSAVVNPNPPPPPSGSIQARQLPSADELSIYVGTNSTAPTSQMKPVKQITASSGTITWQQYAAHNNLCIARVVLNGKPPDNVLLPASLIVAYVDGSSETLPVKVWVSEGNLNDPAQKALAGMTTA